EAALMRPECRLQLEGPSGHVGFRVLRELATHGFPEFPRPPLAAPGEPLFPGAWVRRPGKLKGLRTWSLTVPAHNAQIQAVAWSPRGDCFASGDHNGVICLWDADCRLQRILLGHEKVVYGLAFSNDGALLASASADGSARLWDAANGK